MKKLIAGNWKMNGSLESALDLADAVASAVEGEPALLERCDFLVCPPFVHLQAVSAALSTQIALGAQDCSDRANGAFTGDVSASMVKDIGANYVILGHSERRQYHGESNMLVAGKANIAHEHGLITIICVGETDAQREAGKAMDIVSDQLLNSIPDGSNAANTVIAYEPVWAIGTGKTASVDDVREMHLFIRDKLKERLEDYNKMRILYGGSVKPENAAALMAVENVDGALIGGASLKAEDYLGIARAVA